MKVHHKLCLVRGPGKADRHISVTAPPKEPPLGVVFDGETFAKTDRRTAGGRRIYERTN